MNRRAILSTLLALAAGACGGGERAAPGPSASGSAAAAPVPQLSSLAGELHREISASGKRRVAVLELASSHGRELGRYLSDKLLAELESTSGLELLERTALADAVDEQSLGQTGLVGEDAIQVGKLVGADTLVIGNVTVLADVVDITVRAVETLTGRVIAVAEGTVPRAQLDAHIDTTAPAAEAASLTLATIFVGERRVGERWEEVVVRDGTTLSSGDGIKVVFETNRAAHVYVLLLDSTGKAGVIFPQQDISASNRVKGGRQIEIPPGNQWFFLDENTGTERLYVLASIDEMPQIDTLVARLEELGLTGNDTQVDDKVASFVGGSDGVIKRGIGGVRKGHTQRVQLSDGGVVEQVVDMISGSGAVVRAVSFVHR